MSWHISQNHVISTPEATTETGKSDSKPDDDTERDEIAQGFCLKKAWESVSFHSLEHVVLGIVKDFRIVSAFLLNSMNDPVEGCLGEDDFTFGAWQDKSVQDLFSTGTNIGTGYRVAW